MLPQLVLLLLATVGNAEVLVCKRCRHADLSTIVSIDLHNPNASYALFQPKFAKNSRIVFRLPDKTCREESVKCAETEVHCVTATTRKTASHDNYAVRCIHKSMRISSHTGAKGLCRSTPAGGPAATF